MSKDIRESTRDKWRPAGGGGSLFHLQRDILEGAIREHESCHQETGEPISEDDAVALVERIKNLYLSDTFEARAAYIDFLAGQCLTLKEGSAMPDEYITASAQLKLPSEVSEKSGLPSIVSFNLAIPVGLDRAFGSESFDWLCARCKSVARELGRRRYSPVSFTDHFGFVTDRKRHVHRDSQEAAFAKLPEAVRANLRKAFPEIEALAEVPVVPAPDEGTIARHIELAPSRADYWGALAKAAAILRKHRQPGGEVLRDWAMDVLGGLTTRPDGRKVAREVDAAERDRAIIEAVRALKRCGWKVVNTEDEPGPACEVVARVFGLAPTTIRNHVKGWKNVGALLCPD